MPLTGDFAKLKRITRKLERLSQKSFVASGPIGTAAKEAAPVIEDAIRNEFATGTDAYGGGLRPDKPATFARGTSSIFFRSGLASQVWAKPELLKIRVAMAGYMKYHLSTRGPFLPPKGGAKPSAWIDAIRSAVSKAMADELGGDS